LPLQAPAALPPPTALPPTATLRQEDEQQQQQQQRKILLKILSLSSVQLSRRSKTSSKLRSNSSSCSILFMLGVGTSVKIPLQQFGGYEPE
jgi:hypothetical protein